MRPVESAVEYVAKASMNLDNKYEGRSFQIKKAPKGKKVGRKSRPRREAQRHSLAGQPVAELRSTTPCKICGHPVDQTRLHAHMVRFHGAGSG